MNTTLSSENIISILFLHFIFSHRICIRMQEKKKKSKQKLNCRGKKVKIVKKEKDNKKIRLSAETRSKCLSILVAGITALEDFGKT